MLPLWKKAGREAGLLRSKFDDDCIWMIRNAPYLSCPNWEDRRKSLTHIFTFVVAWSCFSTKPDATRGCYCTACMPQVRSCAKTQRAGGGSNHRLIATWYYDAASQVHKARDIKDLPKIPLEISSRKRKPIFMEICSTWTWAPVSLDFSIENISYLPWDSE